MALHTNRSVTLLVLAKILVLVTVLLLAAMLVGACQPVLLPASETTTTNVPSYTPEFLSTGCLYQIPPEVEAECGFLLVPEDRSQPDGRTVRLHVVRFKSTSSTPAATPLILLQGGPGSPGMQMVEPMWQHHVGRTWRARRDVIYIDQRGTNFSIPKLYCPETTNVPEDYILLPFTDQRALRITQQQACYRRLVDEGINVSAYNVAESAADINDLRIVLGYDKVNLYGFSYGSFLALTVMRQYSETLRSVILDAVWPPGVDIHQEKPFCIQSGLDAIVAGCIDDEACRAVFPHVEEQFYSVLSRLSAEPIKTGSKGPEEGTQILLDDLKYLSYIVSSIQEGAMRYLPYEIAQSYAGDFRAPVTLWLGDVRSSTKTVVPGYHGTAVGMYYSNMCSYALNFSGQQFPMCEDGQDAPCAEIHPSIASYASNSLQACTFWEVAALEPRFAVDPIVSDVPTLLLSGSYDCGLPPYLSQDQTAGLVNSFHFELPVGHVAAFSPCGISLITRFLVDPAIEPESSCVEQMKVDWVLPK